MTTTQLMCSAVVMSLTAVLCVYAGDAAANSFKASDYEALDVRRECYLAMRKHFVPFLFTESPFYFEAGAFVIVPICLFSSVVPESYDKRPSATTHSLLSFDGMPDKQSMAGSAELLDGIWKKEFSIREYSDPMTKENRKSYSANVAYMRGFIAWCKEEGLKPVFVLPPAAESLRRLFPDSFLQTYVYDFVRDVTKGTDVRFLDYWRDAEFLDVRLYATSLFLNKTGRRRFTARVIADFSKRDMAYK